MLKVLIALSASALVGTFINLAFAEGEYFQNKIRPFSTDGCSRFPDGLPFFDDNKWRKCCVIHDIAYWQGGTEEDRHFADKTLRECVAQAGESEIAFAMYIGVRIGGYIGLPTTWRWGYGWTINREYKPLNLYEKMQVQAELELIMPFLDEMEVISLPIVPIRSSLTGDYCKDIAIEHISSRLGGPFYVEDENIHVEENANGWLKSLTIKPKGCAEPFVFTYLLLQPNACDFEVNELLARGRIRLQSVDGPEVCTR